MTVRSGLEDSVNLCASVVTFGETETETEMEMESEKEAEAEADHLRWAGKGRSFWTSMLCVVGCWDFLTANSTLT